MKKCIKEITGFITNGAETFRQASRGKYEHDSDAIKGLRKEMFDTSKEKHKDACNLRQDRRNVSKDMRRSFTKLTTTNE